MQLRELARRSRAIAQESEGPHAKRHVFFFECPVGRLRLVGIELGKSRAAIYLQNHGLHPPDRLEIRGERSTRGQRRMGRTLDGDIGAAPRTVPHG